MKRIGLLLRESTPTSSSNVMKKQQLLWNLNRKVTCSHSARQFSTQNDNKDESKTEDTKFQRPFSKPYEKPAFLSDDYDHLSGKKPTATASIVNDDDDFLPDYMVKDAPSYKRNVVSINMPWLISGAPTIDIKTRFMGE